MQRTAWHDLDPRAQRVVLVAAGVEAGLRIAALVDLARRPASEVRGDKRWWALALLGVSSFGVLPIAYLLRGRR
jgi:hypothetical protein